MYATRRNQGIIFKSCRSPFVTAILGQRRVGKSTLVQEFIRENSKKKWVQLNMDQREERLRIEADQLEVLIEERALQKISAERPVWVAIDEAQKAPALFEQIKILYDRHKGTPAIKFILTGSGSLHLHRLSAESLAGRIQIHCLREFCLSEQASFEGGELVPSSGPLSLLAENPNSPNPAALRDAVERRRFLAPLLTRTLRSQLVWGGLPELLSFDKESPEGNQGRIQYLAGYLQTYLERDIRDIQTIADLNLYHKLMEIIAQQTGSVREDKKILDALGCNRQTLQKYRGYLEATLVYQEIFPFIEGTLRRVVKSPKGYMTNNGLVSYLSGLYDPAVLEKTGLIGHRFENWVLREIQTWLDGRPEMSKIYFWRTSGGVEVDLIVDLKPCLLPLEVTWSSKKDPRKIKHLSSFLAEHPEAACGLVIYMGDYAFDPRTKIHFIPAWAL